MGIKAAKTVLYKQNQEKHNTIPPVFEYEAALSKDTVNRSAFAKQAEIMDLIQSSNQNPNAEG